MGPRREGLTRRQKRLASSRSTSGKKGSPSFGPCDPRWECWAPTGSGTMKSGERADLNPDAEQSRRFLEQLDPSAKNFTFQTFDDDRTRKNPALTRIVQSPLPVHDNLVKLNGQGAGVFVTINRTDSRGRKSENITGVRAVWQEDDDGFDGPFPLLPSMIVASGKNLRKKRHRCGRRPGSSTRTTSSTRCRFLRRPCGISTARPRSRNRLAGSAISGLWTRRSRRRRG